ncbi:MAG: LacI family DNA-binding transcriptional regulator [Rubrivivax sp.]
MTIQDIAREADVHAATVSRALRAQAGEVSEATQRRILRIARRLGYQPNAVAASLRTSQTNLVAIIVTDISNPVVGPIIQGIEARLREHNLMSLVLQTTRDAQARRDLIAQLASRRVSGLVILAAETDDPMLDEAAARGLPAVLVNRGFGERRFPCVVNDDQVGVRLVVEHLAALGHRHVAHVCGPLTASTGLERHRVFCELAPQHGFVRPLLEQASEFTRDAGAAAARRLLRRSSRLTAVFASNDLLAVGVLQVLRAAGLRVPQDVSVVGYNDMPLVDMLDPPLTTVRVAVDRMSGDAARLMVLALKEGVNTPQSIVLPPQLVVRASTAAPAKG